MKQIETVEEIDALPTGSVLIDGDGDAWQRRDVQLPDESFASEWACTVEDMSTTSDDMLDYAPLTLVWEPKVATDEH